MQVEDYFHGLRPLSITFTLPHALTTYSALLLQYSLLMMAIQNLTNLSDIISVAPICGFSRLFWPLSCSHRSGDDLSLTLSIYFNRSLDKASRPFASSGMTLSI